MLGSRFTTKRPARRTPATVAKPRSWIDASIYQSSISKGSPQTPLQRGFRILKESLDEVIEFLYTPGYHISVVESLGKRIYSMKTARS